MRFFTRSSVTTWLAALTLLSIVPVICAEATKPDSPAQRWKITDRWNLNVEYFAPAAQEGSSPPKPAAPFSVAVMPLDDPQKTPVGDWTILRFTASDKAPDHLRPLISAWVLKGDGWVDKAMRTYPGKQLPVDMKILQIGYIAVITEPDLGMPVEMLFPNLPAQKLTDPRTGTMFELRRQEKDDRILMEATFQIPDKDDKKEIRLSQTWGKGETWWRESTRHVNGRKIFHAKLASYHSTEKLEQWLREDINLLLHDDDRLNAKVTIVQDNPTAQQLFDVIQKATGVHLTVDSVLRDYEAPFGSVHLRNCPCWTVMKFIASQGFHNAQWERAGDDYQLKPYGELPPKPPKKPPRAKTNPHRTRLLLAAFFGGLFLFLLFLRLISSRSRAKDA
jgi:hypothetical protein